MCVCVRERETGSNLRLIDSVYHSTLSLRVIEKKMKKAEEERDAESAARRCVHAVGA